METLMYGALVFSALLIVVGAARFYLALRSYRAHRANFDSLMGFGAVERRRAHRPASAPVWSSDYRASSLSHS